VPGQPAAPCLPGRSGRVIVVVPSRRAEHASVPEYEGAALVVQLVVVVISQIIRVFSRTVRPVGSNWTVVGQEPPAGTVLPPGRKIALTVTRS
jgi:beta-lactam-binding protein with PASTA domain